MIDNPFNPHELNELNAMGHIVKTPRGFRAKSEIIRAFLPQTRTVED